MQIRPTGQTQTTQAVNLQTENTTSATRNDVASAPVDQLDISVEAQAMSGLDASTGIRADRVAPEKNKNRSHIFVSDKLEWKHVVQTLTLARNNLFRPSTLDGAFELRLLFNPGTTDESISQRIDENDFFQTDVCHGNGCDLGKYFSCWTRSWLRKPTG